MRGSDVLIVGAGPTGLVLALWLTRQGVRVRIVDKAEAPGTTSRALAVQARTLELYHQANLTEAVLSEGHRVPGINLWVRGRKQAHIGFETINRNLTPYGPLIYPQDKHERLLIARLEALGVIVERGVELVRFTGEGSRVTAVLRLPDGDEEVCAASYLAGCDGARSAVRHGIGAGFPGGTYQQVFYVADVEADGPALDGELHVDLDEADFLAVFPMHASGSARLIGTVRDARAEEPEILTFDDVSDRAIDHMKVQVRKVNWFSTYRVHHRLTNTFRKGRVFLLGDAAHIHSPAGGQGMNTGIGDAINLAWKLKAVLSDKAPDALLDSYELERRAFARKLVATTDRGFTLATAEGRVADFVRTRIVPLIVPALFQFEAMRDYMFATVAQITLAYNDSPLSAGIAGNVQGGDRLPWAPTPAGDNFASLDSIGWQIHVYGAPENVLRQWSEKNGIAFHAFSWQERHAEAGLEKDAMYLLRPDTYVALAATRQDPQLLQRYFSSRGIFLPVAPTEPESRRS